MNRKLKQHKAVVEELKGLANVLFDFKKEFNKNEDIDSTNKIVKGIEYLDNARCTLDDMYHADITNEEFKENGHIYYNDLSIPIIINDKPEYTKTVKKTPIWDKNWTEIREGDVLKGDGFLWVILYHNIYKFVCIDYSILEQGVVRPYRDSLLSDTKKWSNEFKTKKIVGNIYKTGKKSKDTILVKTALDNIIKKESEV